MQEKQLETSMHLHLHVSLVLLNLRGLITQAAFYLKPATYLIVMSLRLNQQPLRMDSNVDAFENTGCSEYTYSCVNERIENRCLY